MKVIWSMIPVMGMMVKDVRHGADSAITHVTFKAAISFEEEQTN
jgi:hypothetical protein